LFFFEFVRAHSIDTEKAFEMYFIYMRSSSETHP